MAERKYTENERMIIERIMTELAAAGIRSASSSSFVAVAVNNEEGTDRIPRRMPASYRVRLYSFPYRYYDENIIDCAPI